MAKKMYWIQDATEGHGNYRASVKRRYGKKGFSKQDTIKTEIINRDAKKGGKLGKQARLAKTLKALRH